MPYILNKTDGTVLTTVQDASLDITTNLFFVGRNYAGYGEWQNENFLKLLENFSNTIPPDRPIKGQLWYDVNNQRISVYNNENWKPIASLEVSSTNPINTKEFVAGDFWFDSREQQLYAYNGDEFSLIGPPSGADTRAFWRGDVEYSQQDPGTPKYNIKSIIGANDEVIAIVSAETYTVTVAGQEPFPTYPVFNSDTTSTIAKGITLFGADYITGESESKGIYFWGTAKHAVQANSATTTVGLSLGVSPTSTAVLPIPYTTSTVAGEATTLYTTSSFFYNPGDDSVKASIFKGIATSAYYADLAERYAADDLYEPGTVVVIGGEKEITLTNVRANPAVAGVISENPAYMMNSEAGSDNTHPYVALSGRVKCKVYGPIKKGQLLVSSIHAGRAELAMPGDHPCAIIGKALEDHQSGFGVIEIKV